MRPELLDSLRDPSGSGPAEPLMILDKKLAPRRFTLSDSPTPGTVVPLSTWLAQRDAGADLTGVGVLFPNDQDVAALLPWLDDLPVIALSFPTFRDGRAYSQARKLSHLFGYRGPILAVGDVLRDQLLYMSRVGFTAFHLREDQDPRECLRAFSLYSAWYQY